MKGKLFAAKAELKIRKRQLNAAQRGYEKVLRTIDEITRKLEGVESAPQHPQRGRGEGAAGSRDSEQGAGDVPPASAPEVQRHAGVAGTD